MTRVHLLTAMALLSVPFSVSSAGLPWYAGVSAGASSLRPDTDNSAFERDSSTSFGAGLFVGYDLSFASIEASYINLGSATLSSGNGETDIDYAALSLGGIRYFLGNTPTISQRNGLTPYVKLGVSAIQNDADIPLEQEDNIAIWAGVGAEWSFTNTLSVRGELTSFDGDAQAALVSLMYRPDTSGRSARSSRPTQASTTPSQRPSVTSTTPTTPSAPQTNSSVAPSVTRSSCSTPAVGEPTDAQGCGSISGPVAGVDFASGTASLSTGGQRALDQLSVKLLNNSNLTVEIQAHTESFGNAERAKEVARLRTIAVARYLASKGVPVSRLRARAFGHTQPLASDQTVSGRKINNRIELRVLQ